LNTKRPVNLDLASVRLPPAAFVSILHRISGVFLFLAIAPFLYGLELSLQSPADFEHCLACLQSTGAKCVAWLLLTGLGYHFVAGIRHLVMDMGVADSRQAGEKTAWLTLSLSLVLSIMVGVWIW